MSAAARKRMPLVAKSGGCAVDVRDHRLPQPRLWMIGATRNAQESTSNSPVWVEILKPRPFRRHAEKHCSEIRTVRPSSVNSSHV
jgi:hypothetical protein